MKLLNDLKKLVLRLPEPKNKPLEFLKKNKFIIIAIVLVFSIILYSPRSKTPEDNKLAIEIKGVVVRIEVADSMSEKAQGLMYRKDLPENEGMLFVYSNESRQTYWMKNTLIPLDMIWINANKEVVHIEHSAPPCQKTPCPTYGTPYPAQYVLELNGGWSIEHGLAQGDRISFSL